MHEIKEASTFNAGVTRRGYISVQKIARQFIADSPGQNPGKYWVTMSGLRGIGKTTILAQLYHEAIFEDTQKIYASFDRVKTVGATMQEFIDACESYLGNSFEDQSQPLAIFLDEVQYLDGWATGIKTIYDRSKNIFIFCTGSSALSLQTDANVARRMDLIKLHPLCFTEFVMIKQAHDNVPQSEILKPIKGVAQSVRDAIFNSSSAEEAYEKLSEAKPSVEAYWKKLPGNKNQIFGEYLAHGTLPFTLDLPNKSAIWDRINRIMSESLDRDVTSYNRFDNETVAIIPQVLFLLASSFETSTVNLAGRLQVDQRTVRAILTALEKTEIITAIPPKGASRGKVGKASKYLFTSPAMRAALCGFGGVITPDNDDSLKGKLLEDVVGLYLKRMFLDSPLTRAIVEYDPAKGGADFIVSHDGIKQNSVVLEVGAHKNTSKQVTQTLKDIGGKYGAIITSGSLDIDREAKVIRVPIEYFMLA